MADQRDEAHKHNLQGCSFLDEKENQAALEEFDRAVELDPGEPAYFSNRAAARLRLKDHEGALPDLREAIHLDPRYEKARANLGDALFAAARYEEAAEAYQVALALGHQDTDGINSMIRKCREALESRRGEPEVVIQRGLFKTRMKEKQFLGCLVVWALLIVAAIVIGKVTGILP